MAERGAMTPGERTTEDRVVRIAQAIVRFERNRRPNAIGGFDYDGLLMVRDHAAEARTGRTVVLWQGRDEADYRDALALEEAKLVARSIVAELDRAPPTTSETEGGDHG